MDCGVLTLIDVLRIQPFVFASNRLKDIAAGSALIAQATDPGILQKLAGAGRVVFAAGGNALLAFPPGTANIDFAGAFSRRLMDEFPGLEVEIVHVPFEPGTWGDAFLEAHKLLESRKLGRYGGAQSLGLSVTAECVETRQVATEALWQHDRFQMPLSQLGLRPGW